MTSALSHPDQLDESTFNYYRGIRGNLSFLFHFSTNIPKANKLAQDFAMSHLELFCLPMFYKMGARLIQYKTDQIIVMNLSC